MKTMNLGKIIPQKYLDYWTPEDIAEIEAYINNSVSDSLGDYEECLDKIIEIQGTINREFAASVTDNRTSLKYWYEYLGEGAIKGVYQDDWINFEILNPIDEVAFPSGTQNITDVSDFLVVHCPVDKLLPGYHYQTVYGKAPLPVRKLTGVLDIPKVTEFNRGIYGDGSLEDYPNVYEEVGVLNTPNVTDFGFLFFEARQLTTVKGIDFRSANNA